MKTMMAVALVVLGGCSGGQNDPTMMTAPITSAAYAGTWTIRSGQTKAGCSYPGYTPMDTSDVGGVYTVTPVDAQHFTVQQNPGTGTSAGDGVAVPSFAWHFTVDPATGLATLDAGQSYVFATMFTHDTTTCSSWILDTTDGVTMTASLACHEGVVGTNPGTCDWSTDGMDGLTH